MAKVANQKRQTAKPSLHPRLDDALAPQAGPLDMSYLESTVGYAIRRAQISLFQDIQRSFGDMAITIVQFSVLAVVADNPGLSQGDLAGALAVERPRIVPIIDALEQRGLATRISSVQDRRLKQIHLTDEGTRTLAILKTRFAEHQKRLLNHLGLGDAGPLLAQLWEIADLGRKAGKA